MSTQYLAKFRADGTDGQVVEFTSTARPDKIGGLRKIINLAWDHAHKSVRLYGEKGWPKSLELLWIANKKTGKVIYETDE